MKAFNNIVLLNLCDSCVQLYHHHFPCCQFSSFFHSHAFFKLSVLWDREGKLKTFTMRHLRMCRASAPTRNHGKTGWVLASLSSLLQVTLLPLQFGTFGKMGGRKGAVVTHGSGHGGGLGGKELSECGLSWGFLNWSSLYVKAFVSKHYDH